MTVFDDLTPRERSLIVTALQLAPVDKHGDGWATEAELSDLADRIDKAAISDPLEVFARGLTAHTDRQIKDALVKEIKMLTEMCDGFADCVGRVAAMWADEGQKPESIEIARVALVRWQEAKGFVARLLDAVESG